MTYAEMIAAYEAKAAAHVYNLGFVVNHIVYSVNMSFEQLAKYCCAGRASSKRGGFAKIRIRLNKADRMELLTMGAEIVGVEADLEYDSHHNRGENYERIITERAGKHWVKDSTPFWHAGDININGQEVQIKFDGAELTNERAILTAFAA